MGRWFGEIVDLGNVLRRAAGGACHARYCGGRPRRGRDPPGERERHQQLRSYRLAAFVQINADEQSARCAGKWPATPVSVDAQRTIRRLHRQIMFESEPLHRVASEFNRYTPTPIEIDGTAVAGPESQRRVRHRQQHGVRGLPAHPRRRAGRRNRDPHRRFAEITVVAAHVRICTVHALQSSEGASSCRTDKRGGRLRHRRTTIAAEVSALLRAIPMCAPAALTATAVALAQSAAAAVLPVNIPGQLPSTGPRHVCQADGVAARVPFWGCRQPQSASSARRAQRRSGADAPASGDRVALRVSDTRNGAHFRRRAYGRGADADVARGRRVRDHHHRQPARGKPARRADYDPRLGGQQLRQLGVTSLNALLKYTSNVTFSGNGPGTGNIFVRGLGFAGSGNQSQATTAPFPNVALYLDEQSMQFPARDNDIYLVDMDRVEVLEGAQGTLFGGGAEAGAIRYITNKPKFDAVSGEVNAGYGITAGGDPNTTLNALLNLQLTSNFALRGVVFSERHGGYVDNLPATISFVAEHP